MRSLDISASSTANIWAGTHSQRPVAQPDWLRGWTEHAGPLLWICYPRLPATQSPARSSPGMINDLMGLWNQREKLYEALDQLPQTLCHNDVFPRNLFVRGDVRPDQVWPSTGPSAAAPVGQELSALVGATQAFLESRPERWDDLERDCLDGYAEGLRQAGWQVRRDPPRLSPVDCPTFRPRLSTTSYSSLTLTTEHQDLVERVFGCTYDEFVANAAASFQFQQRRIHEWARALSRHVKTPSSPLVRQAAAVLGCSVRPLQHAADMGLDGPDRDEKATGDVVIAGSSVDQSENFSFAGSNAKFGQMRWNGSCRVRGTLAPMVRERGGPDVAAPVHLLAVQKASASRIQPTVYPYRIRRQPVQSSCAESDE